MEGRFSRERLRSQEAVLNVVSDGLHAGVGGVGSGPGQGAAQFPFPQEGTRWRHRKLKT